MLLFCDKIVINFHVEFSYVLLSVLTVRLVETKRKNDAGRQCVGHVNFHSSFAADEMSNGFLCCRRERYIALRVVCFCVGAIGCVNAEIHYTTPPLGEFSGNENSLRSRSKKILDVVVPHKSAIFIT